MHMSQSNGLISFLRHYGPIPAGDNMYDELIQTEIERHGIDPVIQITPARLKEAQENFGSKEPRNVILTGDLPLSPNLDGFRRRSRTLERRRKDCLANASCFGKSINHCQRLKRADTGREE